MFISFFSLTRCRSTLILKKISIYNCEARALKKIKNETELVREALRIGAIYVEKRKAGKFEETDSSRQKIEYLYRLLVHDKLIQPLVKGQESEPNMKHKLALWISRQLPEGHPLLK